MALVQGAAGSVTDVGAAGSGDTGAVNVYGVLAPQALFAVTDTLPVIVPAVSVALVVALVPLHPVPLTVHVYEVAPDTVGTG